MNHLCFLIFGAQKKGCFKVLKTILSMKFLNFSPAFLELALCEEFEILLIG